MNNIEDTSSIGAGAWITWPLCAALVCFLAACGSDETGSSGDKWKTGEDLGMGSGDMSTEDMTAEDMGMEEDLGPMRPPEVEAPLTPYSIETTLMPVAAQAGDEVAVSCKLFDESGEEVINPSFEEEAEFSARLSPASSVTQLGTLSWRAERAGEVGFSCTSGKFGLIDETPAILTISPGPAHSVVTSLDRRTMRAGESARAVCEVYDAYGNLIEDAEPTLVTDVMGDGIFVVEDSLSIERAGRYEVSCQVDGAVEVTSQQLEVTPDIPASLTVGKVPDQPVYGIGQLVTIETIVLDRFSNVIDDAPIIFTSMPEGVEFGTGRFRYLDEGLYTVTAIVDGPTHMGAMLSGSVDILVNGTGPAIDCVSPAYGSQVDTAPGSTVTFQGMLSDTNGALDVSVNGSLVNLEADGSFSRDITVRYGMNFVDVTGTDSFGEQNSRTCVFQVSDNWSPESELVADSLTLKLTQNAIDDSVANDGLDSLNDVLLAILNSNGLILTLHDALVALGDPIYNECEARDPIFNSCLARLRIHYRPTAYQPPNGGAPRGVNIGGPNTSELTLVNDGLRIKARVEDIDVYLRVSGTISSSGYANADYVEVDLTSDLELQNGRPSISLRQINSTDVGNISLHFSGFGGFLLDIAELFLQNQLQSLLRDTLRNFVDSEFNSALDGIVSGLDVSSLGTDLAIPRLDGTGDINLGFTLNFSSLAVNTARALFGLGTNFTLVGPPARATPSLGAPYPTGAVKLDPAIANTIGLSVHVTVLNKILHGLWRGGFFDATLGSSLFGNGAPMGTTVSLQTNLPPMLVLKSGGKVDLHLGAVRLGVTYPGLFEDPLFVDLGATARTSVSLNGDQLEFNNIVLDEFYFSVGDVSLDETTRDVLEGFLKDLVQSLVNQSLNGALPSLPIPSFDLPSSLSTYGLPVNSELGIRNPGLDATDRHFVLDGNFGIR